MIGKLEVIELDPNDPLHKVIDEVRGKLHEAAARAREQYKDLFGEEESAPTEQSEVDEWGEWDDYYKHLQRQREERIAAIEEWCEQRFSRPRKGWHEKLVRINGRRFRQQNIPGGRWTSRHRRVGTCGRKPRYKDVRRSA